MIKKGGRKENCKGSKMDIKGLPRKEVCCEWKYQCPECGRWLKPIVRYMRTGLKALPDHYPEVKDK
jgi:hypothetical protein